VALSFCEVLRLTPETDLCFLFSAVLLVFAVPTLEKLVEAVIPSVVVTTADRPRGRGMEVAVSPVKGAATAWALPCCNLGASRNNANSATSLLRCSGGGR